MDTSEAQLQHREMTPFTSDDSGHGVAEDRIVEGFVESILNDTKPPIDVYDAMDYTAPGICAHLSAEKGWNGCAGAELSVNQLCRERRSAFPAKMTSHLFKRYDISMDFIRDPSPQIHIGETLSEPVFLDQIEHPFAGQCLSGYTQPQPFRSV